MNNLRLFTGIMLLLSISRSYSQPVIHSAKQVRIWEQSTLIPTYVVDTECTTPQVL